MRRSIRKLVINRPRETIHFDPLETGGIGILQILDDPKAAAIIEFDCYGLSDHRFTGKKFCLQAIGEFHVRNSFLRRVALRKCGKRPGKENRNDNQQPSWEIMLHGWWIMNSFRAQRQEN